MASAPLNAVYNFEFGSTTGTLIAGGSNRSIVNQLSFPLGLALDSSGYLYIVDNKYNGIVQLLNENGDLRTIAGELYQNLS